MVAMYFYLTKQNAVRQLKENEYRTHAKQSFILDAPVFEDSISYNTLNNKKIHVTC